MLPSHAAPPTIPLISALISLGRNLLVRPVCKTGWFRVFPGKQLEVGSNFCPGEKICAGLSTLGLDPGVSSRCLRDGRHDTRADCFVAASSSTSIHDDHTFTILPIRSALLPKFKRHVWKDTDARNALQVMPGRWHTNQP